MVRGDREMNLNNRMFEPVVVQFAAKDIYAKQTQVSLGGPEIHVQLHHFQCTFQTKLIWHAHR